MKKIYLFDMALLVTTGAIAAVLAGEPVHPEKLSAEDVAGAVRFDITEPCGVDDVVYFPEGGVPIYSEDGAGLKRKKMQPHN